MFKKNNVIEIVKILLEDDKQSFFLNTNIWEDPAAWGVLLVDLAKQIADSYSLSTDYDRKEILNRIREGFDAEWEFPTED